MLTTVRATAKSTDTDRRTDFRDVAKQVREAGLLERSRTFYISLLAGLAVATAALIVGSVLLGASWFQLLIAVGVGIVLAQFAFISHEASHRQVFASGKANDWLGRVLAAGVVGMSHQWWMTKHSRHHANPNQIGRDPDIQVDTISFLPEDAAASRGFIRWITQRQGWLFFPLLLLEGANLHVHSIRSLTERRPIDHRLLELALILGRFAVIAVVLLLIMPIGMAAAFFGVQLAVFGVILGASFAPNHKGMPTVGREEKLDFFAKQVRTSRNIRGRFSTAVMGGLNYQIEHHLFPSIARPRLRAASKIVRAHCEANGIPYTETGLIQSYGIVVRYLNRVGLAARDPFECPMLQQRSMAEVGR